MVSIHNPIWRFIAHVVGWFTLCLILWYLWAPVLNWPLVQLTDLMLPAFLPDVIAEVVPLGTAMDVVTRLPIAQEMMAEIPAGSHGDLVFTVNPLVYSTGFPLYTALLIATPGEESSKWRHWIVGALILLLAQTWGVCFEILKTLLFNLGIEINRAMAFSTMQMELTALAYQLGYLILPSVLPVAIWLIQSRTFIIKLIKESPDKVGR
jgi:hypothetical protein